MLYKSVIIYNGIVNSTLDHSCTKILHTRIVLKIFEHFDLRGNEGFSDERVGSAAFFITSPDSVGLLTSRLVTVIRVQGVSVFVAMQFCMLV